MLFISFLQQVVRLTIGSMRKYELMMILSPDLTEEARSTVVTAIESELKD